jgi:signal peptidase II
VQNPGAVFGISLGTGLLNQVIFITVSVFAICIIIYLFLKNSHPLTEWGYTLILSGAVGNLIDRIAFGKVTDFLDFDFPDFIISRWYIFNIADSCIVIGVIILVIYYAFVEKSVSVKKSL